MEAKGPKKEGKKEEKKKGKKEDKDEFTFAEDDLVNYVVMMIVGRRFGAEEETRFIC